MSPTAIFQLLKTIFGYKCLSQALGAVKWPMWINSYSNAMVVYSGFIGIHFYHNQNKIQILYFLHFPYRSYRRVGITSGSMYRGVTTS